MKQKVKSSEMWEEMLETPKSKLKQVLLSAWRP